MSVNEFAAQIHETVKKILSEIHTAVPGRIISYDAQTGLATVQPQAKRKIPDGRSIDYPYIAGVPVLFPSAGNRFACITFPIRENDGCLLIFAESSLDDWLKGGESKDPRRFDLTDAICIPGLWNRPLQTSLQFTEDVVIQNSFAMIRLTPGGGIVIDNTGGTTTINGNLHVNGRISSTGG